MSKQDRQGVRTATDLEQKYTFGKRFAEIAGIATDAQDKAAELEEKLGNALTSEEIFNILTDNGKSQGLFRGKDGELYVNAQYIVALEYLFAKDIEMSGKFTYKTKTFLEPGQPELDAIQDIFDNEANNVAQNVALYDFDNSGSVDWEDFVMAERAASGIESLAGWSGAKETEVTLTIDLKNPQKALRITGKNMWGREIDSYIGVQGVSVKHTETADYIVEQGILPAGDDNAGVHTDWRYEKWASGKFVCYTEVEYTGITFQAWGNVWESTKRYGGFYMPFRFIGRPIEIKQITYSQYQCWLSPINDNDPEDYYETGTFCFVRGGGIPSTANKARVGYHIIGRWK